MRSMARSTVGLALSGGTAKSVAHVGVLKALVEEKIPIDYIAGTSGGNTEDMRIALDIMGRHLIDPSVMITHIGGLNAVIPTTLNLPEIPGGKKLIYTNIELELTALSEFDKLGREDPLFAGLAEITKRNKGLWSLEAEEYLLKHKQEN